MEDKKEKPASTRIQREKTIYRMFLENTVIFEQRFFRV